MKIHLLQSSIALALLTSLAGAANIENSTITQVVKDVSVIEAASKSKKSAQVNARFGVPDIMKTGPDSRAEMIAADQTVTRVGANTLFSFEPQKREINLQKGSILFNSPTGKGGGTIKTAAATASVLGTTLIVATTQTGGFKVLLMEGHGVVKTPKGRFRSLRAGQMVYALPGGDLSGVLTFQLGEQVGASQLVKGYKKELPSLAKIEAAITQQNLEIARGSLVKTGLLASDDPDKAFKVDPNSRDVLLQQARGGDGGFLNALTTDAIIDKPQLDADRTFTFDLKPTFFDLNNGGLDLTPTSNFDQVQTSMLALFLAQNTTVRTGTIDLSPYASRAFLFISFGDFIVEQSVSIQGSNSPVAIVAGGTLKLASGTDLHVDAPFTYLASLGLNFSSVSAGGVSFSQTGAPLVLNNSSISGSGDLFIFAPSIDMVNSKFSAGGDLQVSTTHLSGGSGGNFTASGFGASFNPQFTAGGTATINADGDIVLVQSLTSAPQASYTAGGNMTLTNVAFTGPSLGIAQSVSLTANNLMTMNNVAFQAVSVSLDARTLAMRNVNFAPGSSVTLKSQTGLLAPNPNTNQPVQLGKVNFIQNVKYGGQPAQNAIGTGITLK